MMDFPFTSNVTSPTIHSEDSSMIEDGHSTAENGFSSAVLRHIGQMLMEDDLEYKSYMIQDSALHMVEKSLYEILNQKSSPPTQHLLHENTSSSNSDSSCIINYNADESGVISDLHEYKSSHVQNRSIDCTFLSNLLSFCPPGCSCCMVHLPLDNHSWQLNVGIEKSKNMLPGGDIGNFYFVKKRPTPPKAVEKVLEEEKMAEIDERDLPDSLLSGRKSLHQDESDSEGRSNKNFSVYADESILCEMFDTVLSLYGGQNGSALKTLDSSSPNEASRKPQKSMRAKGFNVGMTYTKKGATKRAAIDMRSLLIQCMQSVAGNDHKSAIELLKQIRACSSPLGSGSQRLAHYFANGLEARLAGAGIMEYIASPAINLSGADVLKALKMFLSTFPFMETSYFFANEMIMKLAEKAINVHIIHFGIDHGFQWPPLIQCFSTRPGGPPKLRITGIDLPQAGCHPDARVKDTGCRIANCCETFNVPFRYNGIAKRWDTITVEDLGIEKDEVLIVNCLYQSRFLFDDTIVEHSPRDAFLNLIKRISPVIFIHGVVNGTHNSPFFISRFREALFHFSTLFDMLENCVPHDDQDRLVFEREIAGNQILNVIAQEGFDRIERPETYKQWQIRTLRAGFRQLPLNREIFHKVRAKVKSCYHKDCFVDEAGHWMLEGWKGRVTIAFSCWKLV